MLPRAHIGCRPCLENSGDRACHISLRPRGSFATTLGNTQGCTRLLWLWASCCGTCISAEPCNKHAHRDNLRAKFSVTIAKSLPDRHFHQVV
jgi:hypothetical protein